MRIVFIAAALAACSPAAEAPAPAPETSAPAETAAASDQASNLARMPSWETARENNIDFRAVGQEPGWMLDLYGEGDNGIALLWDYGEHYRRFASTGDISFPHQGVQHFETEAEGHALAVTIFTTPCQDAMSGEAYPYAIEIVIDGRTLDGCGRQL